jgi:class 3 adenylate cyclase
VTDQLVERRIVSVLFCDLVGFTSLSEQLDAEDVATIQDAYFAMVRETVGRYGGRLEKFIGDAAMAVFGLPRARDDDAERALRAGLALVGGIQQIGAQLGLDEGALRLRVGVNTGEAVAAAGGPDAGRVTGDTVNTAARLQTAAEPMSVLIGEATSLAVAHMADLESAGDLELKGKAEAVPAWRVTGLRAEPSREQAMGALRAPTLGRAAELAALVAAWARTSAGGVERWLIVAPPGVGKSRLLRQLVDDLAASTPAPRVWRTRCRPDAAAPFDAIARLLLDALGGSVDGATETLTSALARAGTPSARADVIVHAARSVLPGGQRAEAPVAQAGAAPREDRDALFEAWLAALDASAGSDGVVWLVEDVHWAGGDVLAFLNLAGARRRPAGLPGRLVIATARPSILEMQPDWAAADDQAGRHVLNLATLDPTSAQALVRALVADALPAELVDRIAQRSDGNCLFIEELLRTWVSVGTLVPDGHTAGWRLAVAADEIPLPTSVQSIYAAQLDDLPPAARLLARRASVAGRRFPVRALESLGAGGDNATAAGAGLDPLLRRDLVSGPLSEPVVGDAFAYRHALLRDAGYASLARAERARLHVRLARWLEQAAGMQADEIAESIAGHYAAALDSAPALAREIDGGMDRAAVQLLAGAWFERAGRAALGLSAHEAARVLLRRAIDLTAAEAHLERAQRWELLAEATAYAADMDEGAAAFEQAIELYRQAIGADGGDSDAARRGLARAVAALCDVMYQQLRFAAAGDLAAEVIGELGVPDDGSLSRLLYARAMGRQGAGGWNDEAGADMTRALELARRAGDERLELRALSGLTVARAETGQAEPEEWRVVEELAVRAGDWGQAVSAIHNAGMLLLDDQADEVPPRAGRARELALAHGRTEDVGWSDYLTAEARFLSGDWAGAYESGLRAVDLGEANAYRRLTVRTWHVLVPMASVRDDRALLERAANWYASLAGPFPDSPYARIMRPAQDLAFAEAGLIPAVRLDVETRLASYQDEPGGPSWTAAADRVFRHWLETGELDGATRILAAMTAALPRYPRISRIGWGSYELLRARLAHARGEAGAVAAGQAALDHFRASTAVWWMAKAIRLIERAGGADAALLAEATDIERQLGATAPSA